VLSALPGVDLPAQAIATNSRDAAQLPATTVEIDATEAESIRVTVLDITVPFPLTDAVTAIQLDGRPLLGERRTVQLDAGSEHELVITCG
jgi:hypothetical protein